MGVQVYEICRPNYPGILDVMSQIPNINASDLQKLDEKILVKSNLTKGNKIDKIKKDLFKKLTVQVSQLFVVFVVRVSIMKMKSTVVLVRLETFFRT